MLPDATLPVPASLMNVLAVFGPSSVAWADTPAQATATAHAVDELANAVAQGKITLTPTPSATPTLAPTVTPVRATATAVPADPPAPPTLPFPPDDPQRHERDHEAVSHVFVGGPLFQHPSEYREVAD